MKQVQRQIHIKNYILLNTHNLQLLSSRLDNRIILNATDMQRTSRNVGPASCWFSDRGDGNARHSLPKHPIGPKFCSAHHDTLSKCNSNDEVERKLSRQKETKN